MVQRPLSLGVATRRVLADEVTDDLRDAIVSHELEPGRKLTEDELAALTTAGAQAVSLGDPVIRADLAGALAIAAINALTGNW